MDNAKREALIGAIARGWCHPKNGKKEMDSDLAMAICDEVEKELEKNQEDDSMEVKT